MPWLHSARGWGGLLKRSQSPHGKRGRDSERVNATGHIDAERDRESVGSPSRSERGSVRKDLILAAEFLTLQRSRQSRVIVSLLFQVLLKLPRRPVDAGELQCDLSQLIASCLAQSAHEFLCLPRSFLKLWKGLLAHTLICERFYIVIVIKCDEARPQSDYDWPKQHSVLLRREQAWLRRRNLRFGMQFPPRMARRSASRCHFQDRPEPIQLGDCAEAGEVRLRVA